MVYLGFGKAIPKIIVRTLNYRVLTCYEIESTYF